MKKIIIITGWLIVFHTMNFAETNAPRVTVENGIIEGIYNAEKGLELYFGVPFAKPPVGALRWKAPQPAENWNGILETKTFAAKCPQIPVFGDMKSRSSGSSEDCLYLNVWKPEGDKKNLPVLVYFYGGGFVAGDASEPRYDGASIAQKDVIVVMVNYRLNIFGFFAHPQLSAEAEYKASGNYGLLDQNAALKWVQKNIAAFGGNPKQVTIAGESAGSVSVSAQMASPLSKDLIAGAIGESGAAINPTLNPIPLADAEKVGEDFIKQAGLRSFDDLRALSTDSLLTLYAKSKRFGFPTVLDGYFYPAILPEIFNSRKQAQVPLLVGWNSAEIPGMAFMQDLPYTKENYTAKVKEAFPEKFEQVLQLYPGTNEKEIELSATALAADRFISYSTWKWFDLQRKNSEQPVYRYLFSRIRPPFKDSNLVAGLAGGSVKAEENVPKLPQAVGAAHASEIEYCMGNLSGAPEFAWQEADYKVSEVFMNYFVNFIKTGNPNGDGLPQWPAAKRNDRKPFFMNIDVDSKAQTADNDARYEFLDKVYGNDK